MKNGTITYILVFLMPVCFTYSQNGTIERKKPAEDRSTDNLMTVESNTHKSPQELRMIYDLSQGFESYANFSLDFFPWTTHDLDGGETYGFTGYTFPHMYEPMSFIVFNPGFTDPPLSDDPAIQPHEGSKFAACFSSVNPFTNDDWIISPQLSLGTNSSLSMWVKSYTSEYGLEKYKVGVSATGNEPADFQIISGTDPLEAPADNWEKREFDLQDFDNQFVYIGIQCVSSDAFIFMLDDIEVETDVSNLLAPNDLVAELDQESGQVFLSWEFEGTGSGEWVPVTGSWVDSGTGFTVTSEEGYKWSSMYYDLDLSSFTLSVEAAKTSGTSPKGIAVMMAGDPENWFSNGFWRSGYQFVMGDSESWQMFALGAQVENEFIYLIDWMESGDINPGWGTANELKVDFNQGDIQIRINDSVVASVYDTTYQNGYAGLMMYDEEINGTADFSSIVIQHDAKQYEGFNYFNIYRNSQLIGSSVSRHYTDQLGQGGYYQYYVTAVYDEGESSGTNTAGVGWDLSIEERDEKKIILAPNPAQDQLYVKTLTIMDEYTVYNLAGMQIAWGSPGSREMRLNISRWNDGVYLMRVKSEGAVSCVRFIKSCK